MSREEATVAQLEPVRGPSALGGGNRRFFELLWLISLNEYRKTFFGSIFGYLWSLMRPLAFKLDLPELHSSEWMSAKVVPRLNSTWVIQGVTSPSGVVFGGGAIDQPAPADYFGSGITSSP